MKSPLPPHPDIRVASQEPAWSGRSTLRLVDFTHRRFDGTWSSPITWELWQRGRAAAVLPYDPVTDQIVVIEQFRLPSFAAGFDPVMREIPAGMCEPGEDAEATIRRELLEEAGIACRRMHRIGDFVLSAGASDETILLYAGEVSAADIGESGIDLATIRDSNEDIRVLAMNAADAIEDAAAGRLPNAVATLALLWLSLKRNWLQDLWR